MKIYSIQPNYSNSMGIRRNLNEGQTTGMPQPTSTSPSTPSFCGTTFAKSRMTFFAGLTAAFLSCIPHAAEAAAPVLESSGCTKAMLRDSVELFKDDLAYSLDLDIQDLARSYSKEILKKGSHPNFGELAQTYLTRLKTAAVSAASRANTIPLSRNAACGHELLNLHSEGNIEFEFNKFKESGAWQIEKQKLVKGFKSVFSVDESPKYRQGRLSRYLEDMGPQIVEEPLHRAIEELNRTAYGTPAGKIKRHP